jgi:hypothetical protein
MLDSDKIIHVKKFPLEAEAIARMGQVELSTLSHKDLLSYAQQTVLVMSQLRHYCQEIMDSLDEKGFVIKSEDG